MTDRESDQPEIEIERELDDDHRERGTERSDGDTTDRDSETVDATASIEHEPDRQNDVTLDADVERLADELGRTNLRTTDDGYVEARITDLEEHDDDTIELTARLPTEEAVSFVLEKPIPWSDDFLFARIVNEIGYDAASIEHLVGETVLLDRVDDADGSPTTNADRSGQPSWLLRTLFDLSAETTSGAEWRLVDPRERSEPQSDDDERSATGKLLLATVAVTLSLIGIVLGSIFAVTAWNLHLLLVFLGAFAAIGLLAVGYVCYAVLLVLSELV